MAPSAEPGVRSHPGRRVRVAGHERIAIETGWEAAAAEPDSVREPGALGGLDWLPARVPGTAAGALREAGLWSLGDPRDFDSHDWWFRTRFVAGPAERGEEVVLALEGIATVAEVHLNGERVLESDSMFAAHALDIGARLAAENELAIRCRALAPLLQVRRRPRARWRSQLVKDGNLRFFRTMLLGRAPGFAPGPAAVGPWRPVGLERRRGIAVDELALRPRLEGADGVLAVRARVRALEGEAPAGVEVELSGPSGAHRGSLALAGERAEGELRVPRIERWWPHSHGEPALHQVRLVIAAEAGPLVVEAGRVGFRELAPGPAADHDLEADGLALQVNGAAAFARGALWTPLDAVGLAPEAAELRAALEQVREAGMNMLRLPGTGAYETDAFHDLCDELGLLVWQDFMFANLDYPLADERFRATVEREARSELARLAGRPSLAVLCGNSEVEQQVAMLGLDPALGRGELFGELLPALARRAGADAVYVPSAPCGGDLPFRPDRGVANYYGVGGYRRPLEDARRAEVRFAAECLAFSNVPEEAVVEEVLGGAPVHDPRWKAGVPRDAGTGWDFEDVRDHYLALLYGVDAVTLRSIDHARYLELSRAVTGEVMAEVFGEWRRAGSPCGGGLVLWLRDLAPGAGWGVLDYRGEPKVAYWHLRRVLAPVAVWTTDEGLGGVRVHVANDGPEPLSARLRLALYRDFEQRVEESRTDLEVAPRSGWERDGEALLGRFVDLTWAYRFGPAAQDLVVASLEREDDAGVELLSQAVRFPAGRPLATESAGRLGLEARARPDGEGGLRLVVRSRRLAYGVRVHVPGFQPGDDAFPVEPGGERLVSLRPRAAGATFEGGALSALNLEGRVRIAEG